MLYIIANFIQSWTLKNKWTSVSIAVLHISQNLSLAGILQYLPLSIANDKTPDLSLLTSDLFHLGA